MSGITFPVSGISLSLLAAMAVFPVHAGDWQTRESRMGPAKDYFSEFCVKVAQGQALSVEIDTPHRVDFNVHFHTETDTLFPVQEPVEGKTVFEIAVETGGEYCVMFTNPERRPEEFFITTRYRVR